MRSDTPIQDHKTPTSGGSMRVKFFVAEVARAFVIALSSTAGAMIGLVVGGAFLVNRFAPVVSEEKDDSNEVVSED